MENNLPFTAGQRVIHLIVSGGYVLLLVFAIRAIYDIPFVFALVSVILAAAVIIAVIGIFCVKMVNRRDAHWRVQLATLFLPFVPLAIYLSLFRRVLELNGKESVGQNWIRVWPLIPLFVAFVVFTTAMLLVFGEAVVWFASRAIANKRQKIGGRIESNKEVSKRE
jgi:hypothetical protein